MCRVDGGRMCCRSRGSEAQGNRITISGLALLTAAGEQPFLEPFLAAEPRFVQSAHLPCLLLALGEISVDLLAMAQVIADHDIDVRQGEGRESLRNLLGVRPFIESMNDGVQRDPGAAHPDRAVLIPL